MGFLKDGVWVDKWYDTKSNGGKFKRQQSSFRDTIGQEKFPATKDRYHLYVSYACPWAHRTLIFRALKNLEPYIGVTVVNPVMLENGWELDKDPINQKKYLYEIYLAADQSYEGRVTVPVLWDKETKTIVNNESSEIIRMFNSSFNDITCNTHDYYPPHLQDEIDEINAFVYRTINNGVYKAGFATSQDVYTKEVTALFDALETLEQRLSNQPYLCGKDITEADWRLFTTLIRFDAVYVGHFKCNLKRIADYPYLSRYVKALYNIPKIKETVHFDHIKTHYYASHLMINPTGIIPEGPELQF